MSRLWRCIIHTSVIKRFASENCRRTERIVTSIQWRNVSTSVRQTKCSFDTIEHIQLRCETTTAKPICYRGSLSLARLLIRSHARSLCVQFKHSLAFQIHKNKRNERKKAGRKRENDYECDLSSLIEGSLKRFAPSIRLRERGD